MSTFVLASFVHYDSQYEKTALHLASEKGHIETVQTLLERVDPNRLDGVSYVLVILCVCDSYWDASVYAWHTL